MSDDRRIRGHIPWSNVDARLRSLREIWVATAGPRGPDAMPVWFWWDGESVYFATQADSRKGRNLERLPAVVLHNGDGADPIILRGEAEVVDDPEELERLDAAYREKYVDPHSGAGASVPNPGDVIFRVRPRQVTAWSYATVGSRTDWELG
jgi:nitroimidazol reductase NimA-like FMN-containing flavoprotein (pyridoxamine 5'-phosphate oxidase superfamily)